jgi:nicotinate-nucleotide adenylyltransferase
MAVGDSPSDDPSKPPRLSFYRPAPAGVSVVPAGRRLGILSAAFNPITAAHIALAKSAYENFGLHEILFVLPITQPHKSIQDVSIDARLRMIALAVQDQPAFAVGMCTHGLFIDISRAVQEAYPPHTHLWFITGRDAAERILTWPYPDPAKALAALFAHAELLVADREGAFTLPDTPLVRVYANQIHHLPLPAEYTHVSATEIRRRLAQGEDVSSLVPPPVLTYIQDHRLYQGAPEKPPTLPQ